MNFADDEAVFGDVLRKDAAIQSYLKPLKRLLASAGATELWINRPGEVFLQAGATVECIEMPELTLSVLEAFAQSVAVFAQQPGFGSQGPLLSARLPDGERIQIVRPPAVEPGTISMTVRVHNPAILTLDDYQAAGAFDDFVWGHPPLGAQSEKVAALLAEDQQLVRHLLARDLRSFLVDAILAKKNIAVVGDTGSGKTTLMKAMCQCIPFDERLITIEDVRELFLPNHKNQVNLLYSRGGHDGSNVTPSELIASCMRMTPSRVLPAELRGLEAWDFLKLLTTGHAGTITSFHAESCALAFERFMFMAKENHQAAGLSRDELKYLVSLTIDVVIHVKRELILEPGEDGMPKAVGVRRYVDEVHFDPWAKNHSRFGDNEIEQVVVPAGEEQVKP